MTTVLLKDLTPGSQYYIQVRADSSDNVSEWSQLFPLLTVSDEIPPDVPTWTGTPWVVSGDAFIALWNAIDPLLDENKDFAYYELSLTANSITKTIQTIDTTYTLSFEQNRALFGTPQPTVVVKVRSVDLTGNASAYSGTQTATNPAPGPPTSPVVNAGVDSLDISWTAPSDTDLIGYNVYTGATSGFTPSSGNRIWTGNAVRFTYTSTTYTLQWFKIRAVDKFNQESSDLSTSGTPVSPFVLDITAPATPTGLAATITTTTTSSLATSAAVSWTANSESDLAGYFVRYRQNGTTPWNTVRYDKSTTSAVIQNLVPYVNYDFQIAAVDWTENQSAYSGTATGTGATNSAPSTPTAPTVSVSTMWAQVTVPGTKAAGGSMEADVTYYEVYGSTTTGFTPAAGNMLGVVSVGPAMVESFQIPTTGGLSTQTWFFKIIAVDNGGLKSSASAQTSGTPGLIDTTNIVNLAVTNAKINDLAVDKLTAGSGFINNLSVFSTFTIGGASTNGSIQSFDYSAGTAGFKIASVAGVATLEINQGSIAAPALKIQNGQNLIPPKWADFEWSSSNYVTEPAYVAGSGIITGTDRFFNTQGFKWTTSSTANAIDFAASQTDHNFVVSANSTYILSAYLMVKTGDPVIGAQTAGIRYLTGSGTSVVTGSTTSIPANSTWARYSWTVTIPGTALGPAHFMMTSATNAAILYIDGLQVEEKLGALNTPSTWKPPSTTTINGGMITTGSIISSATTVVNSTTIPVWSIPLNGSASFANLQVRGAAVVGVSGDIDNGESQIASGNYVAGITGWIIRSDGYAEFRNLASDSIDGDAITAGTLSVDKLSAGSLNDEITLDTGTSLVAHGLMGEQVGLGDYGFVVNGPQENVVTFKASTTTTRTLTTAVNHDFAIGSKITVVIGDTNYDGTYFVASVPSVTTFTFVAAATLTQTSTAVVNGLVQGANSLLPTGPLYINFPTDGTHPNIISGQLTASQVTITDGMSIRKSSQIEQGASMTINSVIQPPKSAPSMNQAYSDVNIKSLPNFIDICRGNTGNYFVLSSNGNDDYQVTEHNSAGTELSTKYHFNTHANDFTTPTSLVYGVISGTGRYYLHYMIQNQSVWAHNVVTFDTSWSQLANTTIGFTTVPGSTDPFPGGKLGWDYTNSRLMIGYRPGGSGNITARHFTMSSGIPTLTVTNVTVSNSTSNDVGFIARGDFDFGGSSDKIVTKDVASSANWTVTTNTGTTDSTRNWPVANSSKIAGGFWDTTISKFVDMNTTGSRRTYEGGDSFWLSTVMTDRRYVRYSYFKTSGSVETDSSPAAAVDLVKRARLSATIAPVPSGTGNVPDCARVYLLDNPTDTYPTVTSYFLRVVVNAGSQLADIDPGTIITGTTAPTTNGFASLSGTPGMIASSTGNSFWRGDDFAQFWKLILASNVDASTASGNTPPLRIGDTSLQHLRLDGNEVISMASDNGTTAVQGTLILNAGGQTTINNLQINGTVNSAPLAISSPSNVSVRMGMSSTGSSISFKLASVVIGTDTFNATTPTAGNTMTLHAADIHSWTGGFTDEALSGAPGATTAQIGAGGRIVRATLGSYTTSTRELKANIEDMTYDQAHSVLNLRSRTYEDKDDLGERLPGFIAEEAEEAGTQLWVGYNIYGKAAGFRYQQLPVAHNMLIKELFERVETLESK